MTYRNQIIACKLLLHIFLLLPITTMADEVPQTEQYRAAQRAIWAQAGLGRAGMLPQKGPTPDRLYNESIAAFYIRGHHIWGAGLDLQTDGHHSQTNDWLGYGRTRHTGSGYLSLLAGISWDRKRFYSPVTNTITKYDARVGFMLKTQYLHQTPLPLCIGVELTYNYNSLVVHTSWALVFALGKF